MSEKPCHAAKAFNSCSENWLISQSSLHKREPNYSYTNRLSKGLYTPPKTNMTMEKQPFEDVPPIKNGDSSFSGR